MAFSDIVLDKNTPVPLYYQLKQAIIQMIEDGDLRPGDRLPTEVEFNHMYDVSRTTTRQALLELVQEGHLHRIKGKGTFVSTPKLTQDFMQRLEPFSEQMKRLNVKTSTDVREFGTVPAPEQVTEIFGINPGDKVIHLVRVRYADGVPLVVVDTYLPMLCSDILNLDFTLVGLYKSLSARYATRVVRVKREVEATLATPSDSKLLDVPSKSAIQKTTTIGYNIKGTPIEYSVAHYRGDKNRFQIELAVDLGEADEASDEKRPAHMSGSSRNLLSHQSR